MVLKFFEHDGRWFALSENGTRLILALPLYGHGCYIGATSETFTDRRIGVLRWRHDAVEWMHEALSEEPQRIDKKGQKRALLTIPIPTPEETPCS